MIKISEGSVEGSRATIKRIFKGSLISIGITMLLLLIFASLLTYTKVSENTIPIVIFVITGISILIGSEISTVHIRKNGIVNGGLIGIIYILTIYLISSIITRNFSLNIYSGIMILISFIAGALGRNNRSK